ncbi:MAG: GTP pyrophosphokinase [Bacteroidales bacterium]|nr:GTP pyrophosphokinase [Bacteroidales bacterium]MDY5824861.1 GTP pyrophosphokinase [Candidatus Coprenecus sp.]
MEELLSKAITIALRAHEGQVDKAGRPYASHIMRVTEMCNTLDEKITGALHDIVEDTQWTFEMLYDEGFPKHIVDAVECLTRREGEDYFDYISRVKENELASRVKINDLNDNMDPRRCEELSDLNIERLSRYQKAKQELVDALSKRKF